MEGEGKGDKKKKENSFFQQRRKKKRASLSLTVYSVI